MLTDPFPPVLPDHLAATYGTRVPVEGDVGPLVSLQQEDARRYSPDVTVRSGPLASRLVGLRSWSRRQVVVVPLDESGRPGEDESPVAWICLEDRAAGRTNVQWVVSADVPDRDALVTALLDWAEDVGGSFARHRGLEATVLDTGANEADADRRRLLEANDYRKVRTWLHMDRPVTAEEATTTPGPREGVRVRRVHTHSDGLPVAHDVRTVHRMLEESFADHWGSYRESFAEFVQRLVEDPSDGAWDHWWVAEIQQEDATWLPGGGLVAAPMPATASAGEGTYLEYLGVHRSARGRGVAKALLNTAIRDAAERGRVRVGLEVDADSPTGADGLYESMGWKTTERTETWHADAKVHPSWLLEPRDEA